MVRLFRNCPAGEAEGGDTPGEQLPGPDVPGDQDHALALRLQGAEDAFCLGPKLDCPANVEPIGARRLQRREAKIDEAGPADPRPLRLALLR